MNLGRLGAGFGRMGTHLGGVNAVRIRWDTDFVTFDHTEFTMDNDMITVDTTRLTADQTALTFDYAR